MMDLESVIQSEVSQREKNKYDILTHILGSRQMVQITYLQGRNREDVENGLVDMGARGRGVWDELGD